MGLLSKNVSPLMLVEIVDEFLLCLGRFWQLPNVSKRGESFESFLVFTKDTFFGSSSERGLLLLRSTVQSLVLQSQILFQQHTNNKIEVMLASNTALRGRDHKSEVKDSVTAMMLIHYYGLEESTVPLLCMSSSTVFQLGGIPTPPMDECASCKLLEDDSNGDFIQPCNDMLKNGHCRCRGVAGRGQKG